MQTMEIYVQIICVFIQVYKKEKWPFIIVFQDITYSYVIQSLYMKMKETKLTRDQEEKHLWKQNVIYWLAYLIILISIFWLVTMDEAWDLKLTTSLYGGYNHYILITGEELDA